MHLQWACPVQLRLRSRQCADTMACSHLPALAMHLPFPYLPLELLLAAPAAAVRVCSLYSLHAGAGTAESVFAVAVVTC